MARPFREFRIASHVGVPCHTEPKEVGVFADEAVGTLRLAAPVEDLGEFEAAEIARLQARDHRLGLGSPGRNVLPERLKG